MRTDTKRQPCFQFTLQDLLVVVLATGTAMAIGMSAAGQPSDAAPVLAVFVFLIAACGIGAFMGVRRANRIEAAGLPRVWCLLSRMTATALCGAFAALAVNTVLQSALHSRIHSGATAPAASCKAFAEAEEIYRRTDYDGDGVLEYAAHLRGNNSLLERKAGTGDLALVDKTFANAEGPAGLVHPKAGYVFKVLTAQGAHAKGGKRSYFDENGDMTRGCALIASPAVYNSTGRDSFMINNEGIIWQQDLGPNTAAIVSAMTEFDPDPKWVPAE